VIVLVMDASALVEYLLGSDLGQKLSSTIEDAGGDLHVPFLCDVEVTSALRGLVAAKLVALERALDAVEDYADLPVTRHSHLVLLERVLSLRHNFSAYDATYLALADALNASFVTCDEALARAVRTHLPEQDLITI
jgi:predicted nucleic acid-binding protein